MAQTCACVCAVKPARLVSLWQPFVLPPAHCCVYLDVEPLCTLLAAGCKLWQHLKEHLKPFANQLSMQLQRSAGGSLFPLGVFFCYLHDSLNLSTHLILLCLHVDAARVQYRHINVLYRASIDFIVLVLHPSGAFSSNTHASRAKHTWGNIPRGKSSISFMAFRWETFLLSNQASSLPLFSLHCISICISFWFTSENDPLGPISFDHFAFSPFFSSAEG